jgi:hypothetical protein
MTLLVGSTVTLRPATPADALCLATIRATPEVRERWGGADDVTAEILDDLIAPELHLLVIDEADRIVRAIQWQASEDPVYRPRPSPPPAGRRPRRRQLGSHPLLHQGRVPTGRRHATVRARARRHLARRTADGPARRRTDRLTHAHVTSMPASASSALTSDPSGAIVWCAADAVVSPGRGAGSTRPHAALTTVSTARGRRGGRRAPA